MKRCFKFLLLLPFFITTLFAKAYLQVPQTFVQGEALYFSVQAVGEKIEFPVIKKIDGFTVESVGTSRSISNINGNITSKITKRFRFFPTKNVTIPPFDVKIDNKTYETQEMVVKKERIQKTNSKYFELTLQTNKKELYVGEETLLTIQFKHRKDVQIVDLGLSIPTFENFWSKQLDSSKKYEEGNYIVQELHFLLFPQKAGKITLEPIKIDVATLDLNSNAYSFFNRSTKNIRLFSNEVGLTIKPLPDNVELIGEFSINAFVDKQTLKEKEALSYRIEIDGFGNIDDLSDIKLNIPNTTIYENKPEINSVIENGKYKGSYKKSFSILPNGNFTIPAISLTYFNQKTNKIETIQTKSYDITVDKQAVTPVAKLEKTVIKEQPASITKEVITVKTSYQERFFFYLLGFLSAVLMIGLYFYVIKKRNKTNVEKRPLVNEIKRSKNRDTLLKIVLPYVGINKNLDGLIFQLEKCEPSQFKTLKKNLMLLIKEEKIKEI